MLYTLQKILLSQASQTHLLQPVYYLQVLKLVTCGIPISITPMEMMQTPKEHQNPWTHYRVVEWEETYHSFSSGPSIIFMRDIAFPYSVEWTNLWSRVRSVSNRICCAFKLCFLQMVDMLAILLRGIGWKSGAERESESDSWEQELQANEMSTPTEPRGIAWGGGGGIGGLLVHGPSGSGKSHLIHALAKWCSTTSDLSPSERPYPTHYN